MKFIKRHLSLIFPLVAILLGLEFFIVFDRTTDKYEKSLTSDYSMMVVAIEDMSIDDFKDLNRHILGVRELPRPKVLNDIYDKDSKNSAIPNFYEIKLDNLLGIKELENVKNNLSQSKSIKRIETFRSTYKSQYELFTFIKYSFATFIFFMSIIGFFLIIKQMEVWNYIHAQRMKIMEIFGASLFLRSKVLINMALLDAIFSSILTSMMFVSLQKMWISDTQMDILKEHVSDVFRFSDFFILLFSSISIVLIAVFIVVINVKEESS